MNDQPRLDELEESLLALPDGHVVVERGHEIEDPVKRQVFYDDILLSAQPLGPLIDKYREVPVNIETFLDDPHFMGGASSLWPKLRQQIVECCTGNYIESVWTGSIGTGKTTAALHVLLYHLYLVLVLRDPHREFEMDPASEIAFIMQSVTGGTAFTVDYMRFRRMIESVPWFREAAPHDSNLKATIQFIDRPIMVQPLPGTATAAIGENVMGGLIDEVNHMKITRKSQRTIDGGIHDQMLENYRAVARRRESRFQRKGSVPGMLCLVGSANYAGQFTDRKVQERDDQLARDGQSSIFIYDKRPWEVQPDDRFSPRRFKVFLGDGTRRPRIIQKNEPITDADKPHIMDVPEDYRNAFESDLGGAVKDIAGIALHGFSNFISNFKAISEAFGPRKNIFNPDWCDFAKQGASIVPHIIPNPNAPRYIHLDLSQSIDDAGFAMGHVSHFTVIDRGGGMKDTLPVIQFDALLTIRASGGEMIPFYKLKKLVFALRDIGYPINWVSLDGFQSTDFIQTMRRSGIKSGVKSMDRTPDPYMLTKQAILDGRVLGVDNKLIRDELRRLVWVAQDNKVDHPPDGSKDLSDCAAGVIGGLSVKRAVWTAHGINPRESSISIKAGEE